MTAKYLFQRIFPCNVSVAECTLILECSHPAPSAEKFGNTAHCKGSGKTPAMWEVLFTVRYINVPVKWPGANWTHFSDLTQQFSNNFSFMSYLHKN